MLPTIDEALPPITRATPDDDNPDRTETLWPALVLNGDGCSYDDDWQRMTLADLCALVAALPDAMKAKVYDALLGNATGVTVSLMNSWATMKTTELTAENARLREELDKVNQGLAAYKLMWKAANGDERARRFIETLKLLPVEKLPPETP